MEIEKGAKMPEFLRIAEGCGVCFFTKRVRSKIEHAGRSLLKNIRERHGMEMALMLGVIV
ncbi:hypothetical protein HI806_21335 (plasmid) [Ralstonia solanacearum]|nr:hypothetical protein HI806_21335 [Ralstonia solanacearum]QKL79014.1 hypothetical protein HI805_21340 [Ralstonia solanacearum]QKL84224.1 hypothetical protein HI804_21345 [Ralstonia solanacearum]QKL89436.1 hypothetical protein HI803_21350 [Ralstonia solanacearum]QKM04802.1 hypothetical protein HI800_21345 [Ralstonia solanacearum]